MRNQLVFLINVPGNDPWGEKNGDLGLAGKVVCTSKRMAQDRKSSQNGHTFDSLDLFLFDQSVIHYGHAILDIDDRELTHMKCYQKFLGTIT